HVMVEGWRKQGPRLEEAVSSLRDAGAPRFLVTSIQQDGTMDGPDLALYERVLSLTELPVIASGGVRKADDVWALRDLGVEAAVEGRRAAFDVISRTAEQVFIPLTVGGGVRSEEDVRSLLRAGADKVSLNTAATRDPALLSRCADRFGTQCMVVAIDAKRRGDHGWEVVVESGRTPTGRDAVEWAVEATENHGAGEVLLTSMDRDGTGEGYDLELLQAVATAVAVPVVASGGAGTVEHF